VTNIAIGFNQDKPASRTVMVALDISKVFDAVNHDLLLQKISGTALNSNIVRWLSAYLHDHKAVCLFQEAVSCVCKYHSGVPQGSIISPHLFNFFVHDFLDCAQVTEN
jgi:retron-type reverse transcriptase